MAQNLICQCGGHTFLATIIARDSLAKTGMKLDYLTCKECRLRYEVSNHSGLVEVYPQSKYDGVHLRKEK
jgi:hypothetical protein